MRRHAVTLLLAATTLAAAGCSSDSSVNSPNSSHGAVIGDRDTLAGEIQGTMVANKTYYMTSDLRVQSGDTLTIEAGAKLIDLGNHTLFIDGALLANGTKDAMIYFGPDRARETPGAWGGIACDSPSVVSLKFCRIWYGCGIRPDGRPRPSIHFFSNAANTSKIYVEDCDISFTKDDAVQINGGRGHVLRNTFRMNGVVEGSGVNFKTGFEGDMAYNYIWSANDHAIRVQTSATVLFPQTKVNIFNNTIVNYGGKNPSRPGAGVVFETNSAGNAYNNIFVNGREGLRINPSADTANVHYGNNLFYTTIDSLKSYYYPSDAVGHPQPTDIIDVDPKFVSFDSDVNAQVDRNNPKLQITSPANGAGNPTYDSDLGAFTGKRGG